MIDLYFSQTPNGLKAQLFLEEAGIAATASFRSACRRASSTSPEFLAISPNGKIPAIVDHAPLHGGGPQPVFESGAIMLYLAEKTGRLLPADPRARLEALQWLFWQVSGLGPMAGQAGYFRVYAAERVDAAHFAVHARARPPVWRARPSPRRTQLPRGRRILARRRRCAIPGSCRIVRTDRNSAHIRTCNAGSIASQRGPRHSASTKASRTSTRNPRRRTCRRRRVPPSSTSAVRRRSNKEPP